MSMSSTTRRAALAALLLTSSALAEVVYVHGSPDPFAPSQGVMDFDSDGTPEFYIVEFFDGFLTSDIGGSLLHLQSGRSGSRSWSLDQLAAGATIGPAQPDQAYLEPVQLWHVCFSPWFGCEGDPGWCLCGDYYIGAAFPLAGRQHYGWIHLVMWGTGLPAILGYAYESQPDTPIVAGYIDCNDNGIVDLDELAAGTASDCNLDLLLDECQSAADCDGNGVADICQFSDGSLLDCNFNLVADLCEIADTPALDCDGNGAIDACEIQQQVGLDCDGDGVLDTCQIADDPSKDCDGNGSIDACQLLLEGSLDCDDDGALDACQIAEDPSLDCHGDGVLDACQEIPDIPGNSSALRFAGVDDHASAPGFAKALPGSEITVELWHRVEAVAAQVSFGLYGSADTNRCSAHIPWSDGVVYWDFGDWTSSGRLAYLPPEPIVGSWQHFAFVASQSGGVMRIYRNGVLEAQKAGMDTFEPGPFEFTIGGKSPYALSGGIDEFRVWSVARSSEEIASTFNASVPVDSPGLVAYWSMDEGSGQVATDLVVGVVATLVGAGWDAEADCAIVGDLDGNGIVDGADLGVLLGAWGTSDRSADLDGSGVVDGADLGLLLGSWS